MEHRSPQDVTKRLDRLIADIRSRFHTSVMENLKEQGKPADILMVAHGHILRAFAMRWIGRELTDGVSLLLEGPPIPQSVCISKPTFLIQIVAV